MANFNPLSHPGCFASPLRVVSSAWIEHVPFGMFLVDLLRPRLILELGAFSGISYCAFCQAVVALNLETRCYAVDTWQGDPHAGFYGDDVLTDLRDHHDPLYGSFSRLIRSTFDDALGHFEDGTIDLLHVDGFHTYEAVKHDFASWLPKMTERGVVLFHDVNVREGDFGVWKFWAEVKADYPHFEILHGHGLGLVAVGAHYPQELDVLLKSSAEDLRHLREFFYQLGLRVEYAQRAEELGRLSKEQSEAITRAASTLAEQAGYIQRLQAQITTMAAREQVWTIRLLRVVADEGLFGVMRRGAGKIRRKLLPSSTEAEQTKTELLRRPHNSS